MGKNIEDRQAEAIHHLLLWRHAEAEDSIGGGMSDRQRKLTPRGEQQARRMARWLKVHAPEHLRVLVSPALRTQQTADALGLPYVTDERLAPEAGIAGLLEAAREGKTGATLIVGHQPTLGRAAALLLAGRQGDWAIRKGAVWWLSSRIRNGDRQTVIQAVIPCSLLKED